MNRHVWTQFVHAIDGIHHRAAFKGDDLVAFLRTPNNCALLDSNLKALTVSFFEQDFGMTAGTLMSPMPEHQKITHKMVNLVQFIDKWNQTCDVYQKHLKEASTAGVPLTVNAAVGYLKGQVSPGEEPWVFNQIRSARNLASAINFNGTVAREVTHGQIQTVDVAEHPVNAGFPTAVYSKRGTSRGAGMAVYLMIVPWHSDTAAGFARFSGTKMFLVSTESSVRYVLGRMINDKLLRSEPMHPDEGDSEVFYLRLGMVLSSGVFVTCRGQWCSVDANSARAPSEGRARSSRLGGALARKRRPYDDLVVTSGGVKTSKIDYIAPLAAQPVP